MKRLKQDCRIYFTSWATYSPKLKKFNFTFNLCDISSGISKVYHFLFMTKKIVMVKGLKAFYMKELKHQPHLLYIEQQPLFGKLKQ